MTLYSLVGFGSLRELRLKEAIEMGKDFVLDSPFQDSRLPISHSISDNRTCPTAGSKESFNQFFLLAIQALCTP